MIRHQLTDAQWLRIEHLVPGKKGDRGRHGEDNRLFVDAVLWIARAGAPWRDLPPAFGNWNSVFQRFRRWAKKGVWERIFNALVESPDFECLEHFSLMLTRSLRVGGNWRILSDKLCVEANESCARGPVPFAQPLFAAVL